MTSKDVGAPAMNLGSMSLDVFRGFAAILMIFNHAGYAWLLDDANRGWPSVPVFLGSMAPALFFFATGVGMGLGPGRLKRPGGVWDLAWKCALLVAADQLLFLRDGRGPGLDFFGFIALSMVVVSVIDASAQARRNALCFVGVVLAVRYGVVPLLKGTALYQDPLLAFLVGSRVVDRVSYPLAPWIVYPLMGYWVARQGWYPLATLGAHKQTRDDNSRRTWVLVGIVGLVAVASAVLSIAGKDFYRWGNMNAPFLILSFGVLGVTVLVAEFVTVRWPLLAEKLSLRGVAAFLVVPVHYGLIHVATSVLPVPWSPAAYLVGGVGAVGLAFVLSRWIASGLLRLSRQALIPCALLVLGCVAGTAMQWVPQGHSMMALVVLGQMTAAAMLSMRPGAVVKPKP